MSVLKGAAATALYGARASNGVILITTKKGKKAVHGQKNLQVSLNHSTMFHKMDKNTFPEYQEKYGQGYGPYYSDSDYPGLYYYDFDGDGIDELMVKVLEWERIYASLPADLNPQMAGGLFVQEDNDFMDNICGDTAEFRDSDNIDLGSGLGRFIHFDRADTSSSRIRTVRLGGSMNDREYYSAYPDIKGVGYSFFPDDEKVLYLDYENDTALYYCDYAGGYQ
jgi:TonB-dependent SusC/RagA subfamily outer membrane receptor